MKKIIHKILLFSFLQAGCVSLNSNTEEKKPPKIDDKTSLKDALEASIDFGDETLKAVKKLISKRNEWHKAEIILHDNILKHQDHWSYISLLNAVHLFQLSDSKRAYQVFKVLVRSERSNVVELGWHLASALPSAAMSKEIEAKLTEALSNDEVSDALTPKMAEAVSNNGLKSSYTLVRQGLMEKSNIAFARAMISLNPKQAAEDFLDYLALAPIEELRQLNLKTVDMFTCTEILQHLMVVEAPVSHPHFDSIFNFAISRNNAMAEMARKVLDFYFPKYSQDLAFMLARMPPWMQVAFVERARTRMTPVVGVFLGDLKGVTAQKEVVEEIDSVKSDFTEQKQE
jgi:hypothetical protein